MNWRLETYINGETFVTDFADLWAANMAMRVPSLQRYPHIITRIRRDA